MLAKGKKDSFIDLGRKPMKAEATAMPLKEEGPHYPSLYLDENPLKLTEDDAGKTITAVVKIFVKRVSTTVEKEKTTTTSDLELRAIKPGEIT